MDGSGIAGEKDASTSPVIVPVAGNTTGAATSDEGGAVPDPGVRGGGTGSDGAELSPRRKIFNGLRYIAAIGILAWGALTVVPNPWNEIQDYCSTVSHRGSGGSFARPIDETTRTCTPPGIDRMIPFVLGALVLLLPDLSEIAVPGLLSLKRKVKEQDSRLEEHEYQQQLLMRSVQTMAAQVNTRVDVRLPDILYSLAAKEAPAIFDGEANSTDRSKSLAGDERARLTDQLQSEAARLADARTRAQSVTLDPVTDDRRRLASWVATYATEIDGLLRNVEMIRDNPFAHDINHMRALAVAIKQVLDVAGVND